MLASTGVHPRLEQTGSLLYPRTIVHNTLLGFKHRFGVENRP
jgi:hypothetical protein